MVAGKNILIVDDDENMRSLVSMILSDLGGDLFEASSSKDAMIILTEQKIDVMITDIIMPEMDGVELVLKVKKLYPNIKTLGMSGGGRMLQIKDVEVMSKKFFNGFLTKPFPPELLLDKVEKLLEE